MYLTIDRNGLKSINGPVEKTIDYEEAQNLYVHKIAKDHCVTLAPVKVTINDTTFKIRAGYSWNVVTHLSKFYQVTPKSVFTTLVHDFVYDTHVMGKQEVDDWFLSHYDGLTNLLFRQSLGSRFSESSWMESIENPTNVMYSRWLTMKYTDIKGY